MEYKFSGPDPDTFESYEYEADLIDDICDMLDYARTDCIKITIPVMLIKSKKLNYVK